MATDITALFCCLDDFVKVYEGWERHKLISNGRKRYREGMVVHITPGNVDDRAPLLKMAAGLMGVLLADKGYISKEKFQKLWKKGLHILVGIRRNMKNYLLPLYNKLLMRKRFIVETVFGVLKQDMGLEHSRHRSSINALVHIISCLVAYCLKNKKPKMTFFKSKTLEAYP